MIGMIGGALSALQSVSGGGAGPSGPATQGGSAVTVTGLTIDRTPHWQLVVLALLVLAVVWLLLKK